MLYLLETKEYYKIGYAEDINKRMKQYNTCNPEYTLLDTCEGEESAEKICHKFLRTLLPYKGEWYEKSDLFLPLWTFVKEMTKGISDLKTRLNNEANYWSSQVQQLDSKIAKIREENNKLKEINQDYQTINHTLAQMLKGYTLVQSSII